MHFRHFFDTVLSADQFFQKTHVCSFATLAMSSISVSHHPWRPFSPLHGAVVRSVLFNVSSHTLDGAQCVPSE